MLSLPLVILLLNVIIYAINTIGASTIDSLIWHLLLKVPGSTSRAARKCVRLRAEVLRLKQETGSINAQDEFAKWAKLTRQHDKAVEQHERINKELMATKMKGDMAIRSARWTATTGTKILIQFWNTKTPMYQLPQGWFPWQIEWILACPRAPTGTISIQVWGMCCSAVVSLVGEMAGAVISSARNGSSEAEKDEKKTGETKKVR